MIFEKMNSDDASAAALKKSFILPFHVEFPLERKKLRKNNAI